MSNTSNEVQPLVLINPVRHPFARAEYRLDDLVRGVVIHDGQATIAINRKGIGTTVTVSREEAVVNVVAVPTVIAPFTPFTLVSRVRSSVEGGVNGRSRVDIVIDHDLITRIRDLAFLATREGLAEIAVRDGRIEWGENTALDRLVIDLDGDFAFQAVPKHCDYLIETPTIRFDDVLVMIAKSKLGSETRFYLDDETREGEHDDADGSTEALLDDQAFEAAYGPYEPAEGYFNTTNELPKVPKERIWSALEDDGDRLWLVPGIRVINCIGYLVSDKPWTDESVQFLWSPGVDKNDGEHV